MKVLVTGGAGFVGSTVASKILDAGWTPIILDDLSTGRAEFVEDRIFYRGDIASSELVSKIFSEHRDIFAVIHCAAKIVVPDSVADPLTYYDANTSKSISLLKALLACHCRRIIFSSTAALYESPPNYMVDEASGYDLSSPYAASKWMIERILQDSARGYGLQVVSFRYFNPIGADPGFRSGLQLAEPSHALGMLMRANEQNTPFMITGTAWPTRDGTGIRDYIHVDDLAEAHVRALEIFDDVTSPEDPYRVINLGSGTGVTVRELVSAFLRVSGSHLEVVEGPPRPGDVAGAFTSAARAKDLLGWSAKRTLDEGISDSLIWRRRWMDHLDGLR